MSYKVVTTATTFYASTAGVSTYSNSAGTASGISTSSLSLTGATGYKQSISQNITLESGYNWVLSGPTTLNDNSTVTVQGTSNLIIF
jgi:opacity protein-like surface antigen